MYGSPVCCCRPFSHPLSHSPSCPKTDINDQPPDPTRPPSDPKSKPHPKPWERDTGTVPDAAVYTLRAGAGSASPPAATSLSASAAAYEPAGGGAGPAVTVQPASSTLSPTLSVLQPLVAGSASWRPPSLPEPTIARGSGTSTSAVAAVVSQLEAAASPPTLAVEEEIKPAGDAVHSHEI
jgi:hypothetical protein